MRFQQSARAKSSGLQLHFSGYRDARCPADVACIQDGMAMAFFWLTGPGIQPRVLSLPVGGPADGQRTVRVDRHAFVLRSLQPRRAIAMPVSPTAYEAVVAVSLLPLDEDED